MKAFVPQVAVVAGVGPGLGASLARKFAKEGCHVALLARSPDFIDTLADELRRRGTEALAIPTDVSDVNQVAAAFQRIREQFGSADLLINNTRPGGPFGQPIVELPPESFAR